jgi:glycosyltransferase involved in cell wall biosynthesis
MKFPVSGAGRVPYVRGMITAIIETRNEEVGLAHALAALVPAATEGILRDVIVIDKGSDDGTRAVADAAGCTIIDAFAEADATRAAVERARGDWLLFTPATPVLQPGWQAAALAFIDRALIDGRGQTRSATFRGGRLHSTLFGWFSAVVRGESTARLVAKSAWLAERSGSTSQASGASTVSDARRGAA